MHTPDSVPLEARVAQLAHVVNELVAIVAQLNVETYREAEGGFARIPPKPRVAGYPEIERALNDLRATLDVWTKESGQT